jgi:hypothetical protein
MEQIHYADDTLRTGTDISRAVLAYAEMLARAKTSATVDIPVRHTDGSIGRANLLLGPASQLVAQAYNDSASELIDETLVASIHEKVRHLQGGTAEPLETEDPETLNIYEDL